jgi:gamma-glutamyltranspeptidase / glutathione hydrolase
MNQRRALLLRSVLLSFSLLPLQVIAHDPVYARKGMVVAQEPRAADVGVEILKSGRNAIDAAVAVGFALAVTHPYAGNLGGGGFMLIRFTDGRTTFIDFREKAPLRAARNMYLDANCKPTKDSVFGWRASGVPGTVRGLELAQKKYGSKPWPQLVEPAIDLPLVDFRFLTGRCALCAHTPILSRGSQNRSALFSKAALSMTSARLSNNLILLTRLHGSPAMARMISMKAKPRILSRMKWRRTAAS